MAECLQVSVNVGSSGSSPDVLVAAIGGPVGAIVGFILGFLVIRCFLMDALKQCFKKKTSKDAVRLDQIEHISSTNEKQMQIRNPAESTDYHGSSSVSPQPIENTESRQTVMPVADLTLLLKKYQASGLIEAVMASSLEAKLHELMKQKDCYIYSMQAEAWEHRHTCLMQTFKMIATQYFKREQLTSHEYTEILSEAEKMFAMAFGKYCQCINDEHKHAMLHPDDVNTHAHKSSQAAYQMVEDLRSVCSRFEMTILDGQDHDIIHTGLVKVMEMVEQKIEALNEQKLQDAEGLSHRKLLVVVQAYHGGNINLMESMRTKRSYMETVLQRLTKAGHVSSDDCARLWSEYRNEIESSYDQLTAEWEEMLRRMQEQSVEQRKTIFRRIDEGRSKSLQQLLDRGGQKFKIRNFIEKYFATLEDYTQREWSAVNEATNTEAAQAAQLQKAAKLNLSARCDDAQERLLMGLVELGALGADTARQLTDEVMGRSKQADEEATAVNVVQTQLVEREAKLAESAMRNADGHVTLDALTSDHRKIAKKFLDGASYLEDSDRMSALHEYDVAASLLRNLTAMIREHVFRTTAQQLMDRQVRTISLARGDQRLKTDDDVQALGQRLDEIREEHELKYDEMHREMGSMLYDGWLKKQIPFLCGVAAKKMVANLIVVCEEERRDNRLMKAVKREVATALTQNGQTDDAKIQRLVDEHRLQVAEIEQRLRQSHDIQLQMSKERRSSAHQLKVMKLHEKEAQLLMARPQSASSLSIPEVLDRLVEQARNQREIEKLDSDGEVEMATHVYFQRLAFNRSLNIELLKLDKTFLNKVAQAGNLSKKQFLQCVRTALVSASASDEELQSWIQEFSRLWPKRSNLAGRSTSRSDGITWSPDVTEAPKRGRKGRSFLKRVAQANA